MRCNQRKRVGGQGPSLTHEVISARTKETGDCIQKYIYIRYIVYEALYVI